VPLTEPQKAVLAAIAASRDPESFVAGGLPLNRTGPRYSEDIDIFHDREDRVARAAEQDASLLEAKGFHVQWLRRQTGIYSAEIATPYGATKLEWVADSDFRFFPAVKDPEFGYVLHIADLAVNKLMAAATRREPRDVVDLVRIHEHYLPLGAVAWAAVVVAPGFTPEGLLAELRRNARFTAEDYLRLKTRAPIDAALVSASLRRAIGEAEAFVAAMPGDAAGRLFLKDGVPVQPSPAHLEDYIAHEPQRRGHWPVAPGITSAMLEKLWQPI
jgi:Nucleotidyl transferase AbiEii toxin, Type IV TA system